MQKKIIYLGIFFFLLMLGMYKHKHILVIDDAKRRVSAGGKSKQLKEAALKVNQRRNWCIQLKLLIT